MTLTNIRLEEKQTLQGLSKYDQALTLDFSNDFHVQIPVYPLTDTASDIGNRLLSLGNLILKKNSEDQA